MSTAAFAQDPATTQADADEGGDVVVVTGIRKSLETAAQIKRKADTFVDSITASDVAALPDANVAEALGRIPGVSVTRYSILPQYNTGGAGGASGDFPSAEGSGNLIRGLSFVRSEFNGRDQFTANGGRALDWSSIPPELVGGVDVYKNASAELIEGGAGGTINLRTLAPFDRRGSVFSVSVDGTYADLRKEWSPSYSVIASNRWQTDIGEFGLLGSYSHSELRSNINDWQIGAPVPKVNVGAVEAQGPGKFTGVPVGNVIGTQTVFQMRHNEQDRERTSYYLAGQWKNDNTSILVKYINVENGTDTVEHTVEHLPDANTPNNTVLTNVFTRPYSGTVALCNTGFDVAQGGCSQPVAIGQLMTAGTINGAAEDGGAYGYGINTLGRGVVDRSKTEDFSINLKHNFSSQLHLNLDAQYTKATAEQSEMWAGGQTHFMVDMVSSLENGYLNFHMDPRGNQITAVKPGLAATTAKNDTGDPSVYWWLFNADNQQRGSGDLYALRGDLVYDFADNNWFKDIKFGARYSERNQINDTANQNWAGVAPPWAGGGALPLSALPAGMTEVDDYRDFFRGDLVHGDNSKFVYIHRDYLLNYGKMADFFAKNSDANTGLVRGAPWAPRVPMFPEANRSEITEKTTNFYVQLDFEHEFGNGQSIDGNFGVRYAKTELTSIGNLVRVPFAAETACTPGTDTNGVTTTPGACSRNSPQDFLPQTTAYLQAAATPINYEKGDDHILPSFNLKWNLNEEMLIRFGASKNLTRPNIADLRAYTTYGASTLTTPFPAGHCASLGLPDGCNDGFQNITLTAISAGGGNPRLRPTTSDNFDLSYEWYFPSGNISTAVFSKKLQDVIQGGSETLGSVTLDGKTVPITYGGQMNTRKVDVSGLEVSYQQFYDFLPGPLSHLGAQANFTYIDARTDPDSACTNNGEPCRFNITDLFGQSKYLANLVGIYQDDKIEARLAYSWRSRYLIVKGDYMTGNPTYNKAGGFLDASLKYNANKHLQIHTSVENLLDTTTEAEMQVDAAGNTLPRFAIKNDRRIVVGLRYLY
ncbi:TonB-dependent receptor [Asticcacaulis solisilvae]|uniref:TonB-dependent receptor n=1 Tax=Asticcacaulis solisilvae TaxID=1217274 RepID=UPI001FD8EB64|nr:TonB-dependent receptor [Asticcacaulis solisilvae]